MEYDVIEEKWNNSIKLNVIPQIICDICKKCIPDDRSYIIIEDVLKIIWCHNLCVYKVK